MEVMNHESDPSSTVLRGNSLISAEGQDHGN
ncbi:hypothetical protein CIPAW_11G047800 [Carya illinoinensis]|uniref:Uncharacterized protein n=1 Tax=Carya illinoinensis TaxID=32201 RepID=A0A8T1NTM2_CARIL|nr:hypothetical protein CIPAW_11G047800 [Carya illinoinensis]